MLDLPDLALNPPSVSVQEATYAHWAFFASLPAQSVQPSVLASQAAERQIANFCDMPAGWDGHGAVSIAPDVKHNSLLALQSVLRYAPLQDITPNPNGTISFEWETDLGFAAFEIGQTRMSFFVKSRDGNTVFLDGTANDLPEAAIRVGIIIADALFPSHNTAEPITCILATPYVPHTS